MGCVNRISNRQDCRRQLLDFFNAGIYSVRGDIAVERYFAAVPLHTTCYAIAIGKAASAMLRGAQRSLPGRIAHALLITKHGHTDIAPRAADVSVEIIEASHPIPDQDSLDAGQRLLAFISNTPPDAHLLVLISGGASSLVEVLPATMTLADLQMMNTTLLASGMDIAAINRVRKSVSCIKGGRLAKYIGARSATYLLVSDVLGDRVADIGSGLLCRERDNAAENIPVEWAAFAQPCSADTIEIPVWSRIDTHIVASLAHAKQAAANAAQAAGYHVRVDSGSIQGGAAAAGEALAESLRSSPPGVYIWGGEPTVVLPPEPGRGGRNQHLALAAAGALDGVPNCYLLCAGTDGSDGPTQDTGGVVDGDTLSRGQINGGDWHAALKRADAGSFLHAAGDLVTTGPTGTNVMDLMIGLKLAD